MVPPALPRTLLAEIGKVAVIWAHIEQELILHASAMASQDTGGKPVEYLRMDLKRLREKWYSLCQHRFDDEILNKIVHPLNSKLAPLSVERAHVIHGLWNVIGRGKYHLHIFEQKTGLEIKEADYSLAQLRRFVRASQRASLELDWFTSGRNFRFQNKKRTVTKVTNTLIPIDKG
jgi:hypothetical protein